MNRHAAIAEFWNWFKLNCHELHSDKYPSDLFVELDNRVTAFGLWWEVGPGIGKENALTISVSGRKELVDNAKEFAMHAPAIDSWEIDLFKKPKANWYKLELPNDNIRLLAINWTYVMLRYEGGRREILVKGDTLDNVMVDKRIEVAEIVLTNLLGEEIVMNEFDFLDVLDINDNRYDMNSLQGLNEHLNYLRSGANHEKT